MADDQVEAERQAMSHDRSCDGNEASPLLDWLLRKHPDTPKNRAKQWIRGGPRQRQRRGHPQTPPNHRRPGRHARTARSPRHHPGVRFRVADSSARFVALPGFRPRHRQQGARPHLGAGAELRPFRAEHPRRLPGGQTQSPGPRRRRKVTAARLSPAATLAGSSPGPIYQRRLLHGHEPRRAPPPHRAAQGAHHEAGICGLRGRPVQHAQRHLAAMAAIEPGRTAPARPFRDAGPGRRGRGPRGHHPLRSHRRISRSPAANASSPNCGSGWKPAANIKFASRLPTPDSP